MSKYSDRIIDLDDKNNSLIILFDWIKNSSEVFDVGCDEGYFAKLLKDQKRCTVWGLEVNTDAAKKAREICEVVWENNLDWNEPFKAIEKKFDYIVFADVLEHTKNPENILIKARKLLKPNGEILVSIPNIAHISARLELLNGSFEYERTGIFDNTHLKYFTKNTFTALANQAGLNVEEITGVFRDIPKDIIEQLLTKMGLEISNKFMLLAQEFEMQAYQLLFRLSESNITNLPVKPNPFKPMTVADDSVILLRKKVVDLENDLKKYKETVNAQEVQLKALEKRRTKVFKKIKTLLKKIQSK